MIDLLVMVDDDRGQTVASMKPLAAAPGWITMSVYDKKARGLHIAEVSLDDLEAAVKILRAHMGG